MGERPIQFSKASRININIYQLYLSYLLIITPQRLRDLRHRELPLVPGHQQQAPGRRPAEQLGRHEGDVL